MLSVSYCFEKLKAQIIANPSNLGVGDSVLTLLYETYSDPNRLDKGGA